jgi:hypothetical protein
MLIVLPRRNRRRRVRAARRWTHQKPTAEEDYRAGATTHGREDYTRQTTANKVREITSRGVQTRSGGEPLVDLVHSESVEERPQTISKNVHPSGVDT